jgi:hypothetical protein
MSSEKEQTTAKENAEEAEVAEVRAEEEQATAFLFSFELRAGKSYEEGDWGGVKREEDGEKSDGLLDADVCPWYVYKVPRVSGTSLAGMLPEGVLSVSLRHPPPSRNTMRTPWGWAMRAGTERNGVG